MATDVTPLGDRLNSWMADHREQLDRMMTEEGSRAIHEEFMLAESGELPDRETRIERARAASARAWLRHLGQAIAAVWDRAPEGAAPQLEKAATSSVERVEALRLEEEAVLERRGVSGDPDDDHRRAFLVARARAFAEGIAEPLGFDPPTLSRDVGRWMREHVEDTRALESEARVQWAGQDLDRSTETEPRTAAVETESDDARITEAASVFAHVRTLAGGLGELLDGEDAQPPSSA